MAEVGRRKAEEGGRKERKPCFTQTRRRKAEDGGRNREDGKIQSTVSHEDAKAGSKSDRLRN